MKLHLGGTQPHPDWHIFDIEARPEVDFVGDASDLSQFADNSIEEIYASHILEHFHYALDGELLAVLKEWHRVLVPQGMLYISVPDLRKICWLFLNPDLNMHDRRILLAALYGGHINAYDVHRAGFDLEILTYFLREAGFSAYEQVEEFGLFADTSRMRIQGVLISLNVAVMK